MIIITVTLSIVYAAIIIFLAITWYNEMKHNDDTDKRILVLEKRIVEVKQTDRKRGQILDEAIGERIKELVELEKRVEKLERKHISKNS